MTPLQAPAIAVKARSCVEGFKTLSDLCHDFKHEPQCQISYSMVCDEQDRYKIWAGNIGALQKAQSSTSLDYRLKAQPKIANQIIELLEDLEQTLEEACSIASGERPNRIVSSLGAEDLGGTRNSPSESEKATITRECRSEVQELYASIAETTTSLFRTSIIIRNATPRDRYHKAATAIREPFDDRFDIGHVGHMFPRLATQEKEWLKRRLGQAITQRRKFLRYCQEHRAELSKEPKHELATHSTADGERQAKLTDVAYAKSKPDPGAYTLKSRLSSCVAPTTASTLAAANLEVAEEALDETQLQSSYATSMGEDDTENKLRVPSLDGVSKGVSPFECPYCWNVQDIRQERVWRRHVLQDLKPYVCTFEECDVRMFADCHAWFNHELQVHRIEWYCHLCSYGPFETLEKFKGHMRGRHSGTFPEAQLPALAKVCQQSVSRILPSECPFCDMWANKLSESNTRKSQNETLVVTPAQFRHHVGAHMEQLALFAIPRSVEDDKSAKSSGVAAGISTDTSQVKGWETSSVASYENDKNPTLHVAAYEGLEAEVAQLLEEGADMNSPGETWGSPLLAAIAGGSETVVRVLLAAGADPYIRDRDSMTALEVAAHKGQSSLTRLILATDDGMGPKDMSEMRRIVARYIVDGQVDLAEKLLVQMVETPASSHPDTLSSMNDLAVVLQKRGRLQEAEKIHRATLMLREKVLSNNHSDSINSMDNLAAMLYIQGRYGEAKNIYQEIFKLREKVLGKEHPITLHSINNLTLVLKRQSELAGAEMLCQKPLKLQEKVLGKEHPDTLISINDFRVILDKQERLQEAIAMHQATLKLQQRVLGKEHSGTLISTDNLAVLGGQGTSVMAERLLQEPLNQQQKVLGKEQPDTLTMMSHLAGILLLQGRYIEAGELSQRVLQMRQKVLGEDHPSTLTVMSLLAESLEGQGKYDKAEQLYGAKLQKNEMVLGPANPGTLLSVCDLASLSDAQGRYEEAASLYQRAVQGYIRCRGPEHPTTLECTRKYTNMVQRREESLGTTSTKSDELALKESQDS